MLGNGLSPGDEPKQAGDASGTLSPQNPATAGSFWVPGTLCGDCGPEVFLAPSLTLQRKPPSRPS